MPDKFETSQQHLELMINSIDGVVWAFDMEARKYTFMSPQIDDLFPGVRDSVCENPNSIYNRVHPEDRDSYRRDFLTKLVRQDSFQLEYRLLKPDNEVVYIRDVITPMTCVTPRTCNGKQSCVTGIMFDVSRYKQATQEKAHLEVQLRQAQKLEAVGQLAAGIAHEINTPTQFVGDNIHFLRDAFRDLLGLQEKFRHLLEQAPDIDELAPLKQDIARFEQEIDINFLLEEVGSALDQSIEGIERIGSIVKAMKAFSHPGSSEKEAIDLNQAIESTLTVARNEWKYVAEVETELAEDLPLLSCFPGEINQTILNIIVNAAHAIEEKQEQTHSTGKGLIKVTTELQADQILLTISDTGCGIPKAHIQKIFDPFFTTKEVGKGTGQGLSMAYSAIKDRHGGALRVESTPGEGSRFIISLPA